MLLSNPIIQRELVTTLRTRRAAVLQIVVAVVLTLLVLLRWPTEGRIDMTGAQAQGVLVLFGYGLLTCIMLLAPVFPALSIVRERQSGTLALVLNSPLGAGSILIGKLIGALGFVFILLLLSLPAATACFTMGGVSLEDIGRMYVVLIMLSLQYAAMGLLVSAFASQVDGALRMTYFGVLLLGVVVIGPYQFGQGLLPASIITPLAWVRALSPIPAMMQSLGQGGLTGATAAVGDPLRQFLIMGGGSALLFALLTWVKLKTRLLDRARSSGRITDDRSVGVRMFRRVLYLGMFDPQRRSRLIGNWSNPVLVKEMRSRRFGRAGWMLRLAAICVVVSLGLMLTTAIGSEDWGVETLGGIMVLLQVALIVLLTPSLASGVISGEVENGSWTLLKMTPLSSWRIISGKLMSVGMTLGLVLVATLPGYAVLLTIDPQGQAVKVQNVLITLVLTAVMALLVTAAASSLFSRTSQATTTAYTLLVGLCAGTMIVWLLRDSPFPFRTVEWVLSINPLAASLSLIEARGFADYNLLPVNWWFMGGVCVVAVLILFSQVWRLNRPQ